VVLPKEQWQKEQWERAMIENPLVSTMEMSQHQ
jgi:hypothetical protein